MEDEIEQKLVSEILNEMLSAQQTIEKMQHIFTVVANEFQATIERVNNANGPQSRVLRNKHFKKSNAIEVRKKKKSIFGKVYRVQSINEGKKIIGYRVHTKYMDVNHCIGPYASFKEADNIKQRIQYKLKAFDSNDPDVEAKVLKRLNEIKRKYDKLYPPLEMMRQVNSKKR